MRRAFASKKGDMGGGELKLSFFWRSGWEQRLVPSGERPQERNFQKKKKGGIRTHILAERGEWEGERPERKN